MYLPNVVHHSFDDALMFLSQVMWVSNAGYYILPLNARVYTCIVDKEKKGKPY